jgi:hypothetical protein
MRARGGTRTAFQPLQTLDSRGSMRNPVQSGTSTTRSAAQDVHNVHTPNWPVQTIALSPSELLPESWTENSVVAFGEHFKTGRLFAAGSPGTPNGTPDEQWPSAAMARWAWNTYPLAMTRIP